jgi:hypothetical protein
MAKKILGAVTNPFGLVGSLLGGKKKKAETPVMGTPEPVQPLVDDARAKVARKRSVIQQLNRGGRQSTLLSGGDKLGG